MTHFCVQAAHQRHRHYQYVRKSSGASKSLRRALQVPWLPPPTPAAFHLQLPPTARSTFRVV